MIVFELLQNTTKMFWFLFQVKCVQIELSSSFFNKTNNLCFKNKRFPDDMKRIKIILYFF